MPTPKVPSPFMPGGPDAPFGSAPHRAKTSIWLLGIVYAAWFGFLLWMAAEVTGRR